MLFFQYYRIVRKTPKWRNIYIGVMGLICCWSVVMILLICLQCLPLAHVWDDTIPAKCFDLDPGVLLQIVSIGNIVTDVIILLLPIPVVWRLKLTRDQKVGLTMVFCLGFMQVLLPFLFSFFTIRTPEPNPLGKLTFVFL
jgi:hypothetical protein